MKGEEIRTTTDYVWNHGGREVAIGAGLVLGAAASSAAAWVTRTAVLTSAAIVFSDTMSRGNGKE